MKKYKNEIRKIIKIIKCMYSLFCQFLFISACLKIDHVYSRHKNKNKTKTQVKLLNKIRKINFKYS